MTLTVLASLVPCSSSFGFVVFDSSNDRVSCDCTRVLQVQKTGIWGEVEDMYLLTTRCDCTRIDCTSSEPMVVVLLMGCKIRRRRVGVSVWVWIRVQDKEEEEESGG
ncbi:hypothetical protein FF1_019885 [Malus domestica]